ncbi:MAG: hypothetical protein AAGH15_15840 [Myxococcota bacterium]
MARQPFATIPYRPLIEGLAMVADAGVERCRAQGAEWTLRRIYARRASIASIALVRKATGAGVAYSKALVSWATEARVVALGHAIDAGDEGTARAVLDEWFAGSRRDEHETHRRLTKALLDVFRPGLGEPGVGAPNA